MFNYGIERIVSKKKALLIGVQMPNEDYLLRQTLLDELGELVTNLDIKHKDMIIIKLRTPTANFLLGSGKVEEIVQKVKSEPYDLIIFDNELTPAQQRNWAQETGIRVTDRQEVILDIFGRRAQTKEACLQVELACLEYALPRLKNAWTHLSRQRGGGVVQRGEGESQLELDQRIVRDRISRLKQDIKFVSKTRNTQRKQRLKIPIPTAAIVGYTNAGKSSLLNNITQATVLAEDKLFATLSPTTRKLKLPSGQTILLTDTVGFIRNLPHKLVDSFKATLEETLVADFLIHVVDITSPDIEEHIKTTCSVLEELGALDKKIITVFNKIDLSDDLILISTLRANYPNACFISVKDSLYIDTLYYKMEEILKDTSIFMKLNIPYHEQKLISQLHELGAVANLEYKDDFVYIEGNVPNRLNDACIKYLQD